MLSGHTVMNRQHWDDSKKDFTDLWKRTVEDAALLGQQYVISPWLDESYRKNFDDLKRYMEVFNKSGALCKKSGMKFGYHNHGFEFGSKVNNTRVYDVIMKYTDPKLVAQQLDIGNMYEAGGRAMNVIKQYPGRFELLHVKDEIRVDKGESPEKYESTVLGTGVIGVKQVIDFAKRTGGTTQFIIEQESYQDKTPLEAVREDLKIMKNWGY
jgi:sugar phosphate isomerase/epimerase